MTRLPDEQPALRVVPMPSDANIMGDVFGGWIMSHVDVAGGYAAMRRAQGRVVTVAVTNFVFKEPIAVGDLVSFYARIVEIGRSSITVDVEVFAERRAGEHRAAERRNSESHEVVRVTEAKLVYVAVDAEGRKRILPPAPD